MIDQILQGDCLEIMPQIPDKSIDMILCDLPYGTTHNEWDKQIPFGPLWEEYRRPIKPNGAIVLTAQQPFTTDLINSARDIFRYEIIWDKVLPLGYLNANRMPMRSHENILVFYRRLPTYNPQMEYGHDPKKVNKRRTPCTSYGKHDSKDWYESNGERYPKSVLKLSNANHTDKEHPTQKPVALFEYLIKTYTNEGDLVLDSCIGSGTTAVAARNTNRHFIGTEKESEYVAIANKRLAAIPTSLTAYCQ